MSDSTDASLLRRLRTNEDREAWDRFVGLYTPLVRRWAVRLQATGSDVDELTQEVLTALVRALPEFRYDAAGRFRGWLWTITKNKRRELLRHRTPAGLSDAGGESFDPSMPDRTLSGGGPPVVSSQSTGIYTGFLFVLPNIYLLRLRRFTGP